MVFNVTLKQYVNNIVTISFIGKKPQYPKKTTDLPQVTEKMHHIRLYGVNLCRTYLSLCYCYERGPGGSMSQFVGSNNSYKPITNTVGVRTQLCKLQKGCTRLAAASDIVYQLLAKGRWFSPGTPASSTTKTGRHVLVESAWR